MTPMNGTELSAEHHVVRYVKPTFVREDGSVDGSAFCLRSGEIGLSVNWLEHFANRVRSEQLEDVRRLSRITMRRRGRLAELNVGMTKRKTREAARLRFEHWPLSQERDYPADPSHCEIRGLPDGESQAALVGDLIADCVSRTYPGLAGNP